ncbi:MAG: DUF3021 family protein [Treponema sp.]|nr:DUF3021 family protein [Candidatus Treponema caballi]
MNKSKLNFFIEMFSKLTTAILLCSSVYIFCFNGFDATLGVAYIWGVLGISLLLSVAYLPFLNELSKKAYIIWTIVYALFANIVVMGVALLLGWVSVKVPSSIIGMEIVFIVVYAVVWFFMWLSLKRSAQVLNEKLKEVQKV